MTNVLKSDAGTWNVRRCGARGDGTAPDTEALQAAVDACHRAGGGRVLLPPGQYRSGTLLLKSGVELHLAQGAVLLGSPDIRDYRTEPFRAYAEGMIPHRNILRAHLLAAIGAERIAVTGTGTIDGNGTAFFGPAKTEDGRLNRFLVRDRRPWHMVAFYDCRDVLVRDVHLLHAPCYSLAPYGCERLRCEGLTIRNHPSTPNGDGIDPECCRDVIIRGCLIDTADDAIALKSSDLSPGRPGAKPPCENVVIGDCVLRSCTFAIRLGVEGDLPIRQVTMDNLVLQGRNGLGLFSILVPDYHIPVLHGTPIEDVLCSNLLIETRSSPILAMHVPGTQSPGGIRRIRFQQVRAVSSCASLFYGNPACPMRQISMRDVHLTVRGGLQADPVPDGPVAPLTGFGGERESIPHALYLRHVEQSRITGLRVDWDETAEGWDAAVRLDDVRAVTLDDPDVVAAPGSPSGEAVRRTARSHI